MMFKSAAFAAVLAACATVSEANKGTCPPTHPWAYRATNGKGYCCSTADDKNGNRAVHQNSSAPSCKDGDWVECKSGHHQQNAQCIDFQKGDACPGNADFAIMARDNSSWCCDSSKDSSNTSNANYFSASIPDRTYRYQNCQSGRINKACTRPPCVDYNTMDNEVGCYNGNALPENLGEGEGTDVCRAKAKAAGLTYFGITGKTTCRGGNSLSESDRVEGNNCIGTPSKDLRYEVPPGNSVRAYKTNDDQIVQCYFYTDNITYDVHVDGKLWPKQGYTGGMSHDKRWEVHFPESTRRITLHMIDHEKGLETGGMQFFCKTDDRTSKWYKFGTYHKYLDNMKVYTSNSSSVPQYDWANPDFSLDENSDFTSVDVHNGGEWHSAGGFSNLVHDYEPMSFRVGKYTSFTSGAWFLFVIDNQVESKLVDFSGDNKPGAAVSTVYNGVSADRAIDGDVNTIFHTLAAPNQWIRLDLVFPEPVTHVYFLNRRDSSAYVHNRLGTFNIKVGNKVDGSDKTQCERANATNHAWWMGRCDGKMVKHIWIQNEKNDFLHLTEIKVYAAENGVSVGAVDFDYTQNEDPVALPADFTLNKWSSSVSVTINVAENRDTPGVILSKENFGAILIKNQEIFYNDIPTGKILDLNTPYTFKVRSINLMGSINNELTLNGDLIAFYPGFDDVVDGDSWTFGANADGSNVFHGSITNIVASAGLGMQYIMEAADPTPAPTVADGDVSAVAGFTCDDIPELVFDNFWHDYQGRTHVDFEDNVMQFSVKGGDNSNINILLADKDELASVDQLSKNDDAYELFIGGANEPLIHSSTCLGCKPDADSIVDISGFPFIVPHKYNNIWIKVEGTVVKVGNGDPATNEGLAYTRDFGGSAKNINRAIFTYGYGDIECHETA